MKIKLILFKNLFIDRVDFPNFTNKDAALY